MPTDYTAAIFENENVTLKEFVITCMRNFAATITLRDQPLNGSFIKLPEPNDYHVIQFEIAKKELAKFKLLSKKEKEKIILTRELNSRKITLEGFDNSIKQNKKIQAMLEKVRQWNPPTSAHVDLKEFMIQQLNVSIDEMTYYIETLNKELDINKLLNAHVSNLEWSVDYHQDQLQKEKEQYQNSTKWITDILDSFNEEN